MPSMVIALLRRSDGSGTWVSRRASARVVSISWSCGTTSLTMPMRSASWASKWSPVSAQRLAAFQPHSAANRKLELEMWRTSGWANTALSDAIVMSAASWYQKPPPIAQPLTAAMIGLPSRHMCAHCADARAVAGGASTR